MHIRWQRHSAKAIERIPNFNWFDWSRLPDAVGLFFDQSQVNSRGGLGRERRTDLEHPVPKSAMTLRDEVCASACPGRSGLLTEMSKGTSQGHVF